MKAATGKRIYLAGRHPALSPDEFTRRWREHFRLASTRPRWRNIRRYWQYDPFPDAREAGHDAIAQLWFRSAEAAQRHFLENDDQAVMEADEREIFSSMISDRILEVSETVVKDGPVGDVVLFRFVRRRPGIGFAAFAASYHSYCRRLGRLVPAASRFVQNLDPHGEERGSGLEADAVDEIHFAGEEPALRFAQALGADQQLPGEAVLFASVLTRPVPLYDIDKNPLSATPASIAQ